ncbi:MAG TPA: acyltransferase [Phycicoccus sp.]|nr:acyltransferase [Phycicoccus sp.]
MSQTPPTPDAAPHAEPSPPTAVAQTNTGVVTTRRTGATYPALDGLRTVAVAAVVTTHVAFSTGRYERGFGNNFLARMDSGVTIFFVLSGFLLIRPWLLTIAEGRDLPSTRVYALRRFARIYPAYLAAVTLAFLVLPENRGVTLGDWVRHVFLLQTYGTGHLRGGLTQTWSLCVEWAYYLALPFFGILLVRWSRDRWRPGLLLGVLGGLVAFSVAWEVVTHPLGGAFATSGLWLPAYVAWFAGGMFLAVLKVHLDTQTVRQDSRWWFAEELGRHPWTCWAIAGLCYFAALTPIAGPRSFTESGLGTTITKHLLYLVVAVMLAWPAIFGESRSVQALLGNRVMRYFGEISYGVFLYHLVVLQGVMWLLDYSLFTGDVVQVLPLTLVGTGVLAALSYRFLERPLIRRAHRVRSGGGVPVRG